MKLVVLYKPNSGHARVVEEYVQDFERQHAGQFTVELVDVESRDGVAKAGVYDIMQFPALLVTKDDGQIVNQWSGDLLPLKNEVASYLHS